MPPRCWCSPTAPPKPTRSPPCCPITSHYLPCPKPTGNTPSPRGARPSCLPKAQIIGGGADDTLRQLTEALLPAAERELGLQPQWRGLLGYSLAGLFALYAAYRSDYFQRIASVSGSLWFDGWGDFAAAHTPAALPQAVYFSLGDKEAQSRNPRMAAVQTATEAVFACWQQYACPTTLEINAGGHFDDVPQRLAKAAEWLIEAA